jgi:hypothetical protein
MPRTWITWSVLGEAVGTNEQLQPPMCARVARQVDEEDWESEYEDLDYLEDFSRTCIAHVSLRS